MNASHFNLPNIKLRHDPTRADESKRERKKKLNLSAHRTESSLVGRRHRFNELFLRAFEHHGKRLWNRSRWKEA